MKEEGTSQHRYKKTPEAAIALWLRHLIANPHRLTQLNCHRLLRFDPSIVPMVQAPWGTNVLWRPASR